MILTSFDMQYMVYIWLAIAIIAIIIEFITSDITSIWAAVAGFITMVLSIFCKILWVQIVVFFVSVVLMIFLVRPYVKRYIKKNEIKTNMDSIIGRKAIVIKEILPNERGQVKLDNDQWLAISSDNTLIEEGVTVLVLAIEGNKLVVKREL